MSHRKIGIGEDFVCEGCWGTFQITQADADAVAEYEKNFPGHSYQDMAIICDDCHIRFMSWFRCGNRGKERSNEVNARKVKGPND